MRSDPRASKAGQTGSAAGLSGAAVHTEDRPVKKQPKAEMGKKAAAPKRAVPREETIKRQRSRAQNHAPKTGRGMFYIIISALIIIAMTAFSLTLFFDLRRIDCEGTSRYTKDEIISLSGFEWGENLLFLDSKQAVESIVSSLSYIKDASVEIRLPDRAVIRLVERIPYGAIKQGTSFYVFDEEGFVFDRANLEPPFGVAVIQGVSVENPQIGMNVFGEDAEHMRPAVQVLELLYSQGMAGEVGVIDGSESFNVKFSYMGRFTVEMGINENIDGKLRMLDEIVKQLGAHQSGIIDLGSKRARYVDDPRGGTL